MARYRDDGEVQIDNSTNGRFRIAFQWLIEIVAFNVGTLLIGHTEKIVDVRVIEPRFILRPGYDPVKGIMGVAAELIPDLICMTTAGHQGLLDALRGSTTQRVLRAAPCPVLTITAEE